jgi:hypothetical protein
MKLTFTQQHFKPILSLSIAVCLFATQPAIASGKPVRNFIIEEEDKPAKKSKTKAKTKTTAASLNNNAVRIFPDVIKRDMHVVAKENDGKEIDFFVFKMDGSLVNHYKMKSKDHNKLSGLARGQYVYRVFCGDEEKATGNFEIR